MVSLGEVIAFSTSPSSLPRFRIQASTQQVQLLPQYKLHLPTSTNLLSLSLSRTRSLIYPSVLTQATVTHVDVAGEVVPDTGGADFGGPSDNEGSGGGGDGDGGGDNSEGGGEFEESKDKNKKTGMSMSQKLTLGYAALVGFGGLMGYMKSGSQKSLMAGGFSGLLLYYVYTQLPTKPVFASAIGFGISAALLVVMGSRFKRSGKVFPAGVVTLVSVVMTGGYLHGIMRGFH